MYNNVYISQTKNLSSTETVLKKFTPTGSNWVGDSIVWDNNKYKLLNTSLFSDYSNISDLIGKYTFNNADQNYAFNGVEYIADVIDNSLLSVTLYNGADINSYNVRYVYGENFTDNGDGTYTIDNPIEFYRTDWYSNYSAVKNKYLCRNVSNNTCSDLRYVISVSNVDYSYFLVENDYKYANSFTFENGIYTLNNDAINYWNVTKGTNITAMSNAHYTCWNATGECSTISYIYYLGGTTFNYININDGKSVEDALDEMLYGDNVNVIDSNAKSVVDGWYKNNIIDYSDYLEETIFCNDRTASNMMGWNPNGGIITDIINFDGYSSTSLNCLNNSDKFSVDNPIAKLKYSIGLTTRAEMQNMGNARNATVDYRLMTPSYYRGDNIMFTTIVFNTGNVSTRNVTNNMGLRPSVSLKPKTIYLSGDGSKDNPYVIN